MRRTWYRSLLLFCTVALLALLIQDYTQASLSEPPRLSHFGVEINRGQLARTGSRVRDANLSWVRYNAILWSEVEPVPGIRDWSALHEVETELVQINAMGATPLVIVRGTPVWAQQRPNTQCGPIQHEALDAFASFLYDLVARYSAPPYNVSYWEIWNEPDVDPTLVPEILPFGCWGDEDDPYYGGGYYAEMLQRVYPAIKQANPNAQVIMGGLMLDCDATPRETTTAFSFYLPLITQSLPASSLSEPASPPQHTTSAVSSVAITSTHQLPLRSITCTSGRFLEGVLQNGGGHAFDILAYHSYAFWDSQERDWELAHPSWSHRGGAMLGRLDFIRTLMNQYGVSKPVLLNEGSLLCRNSSRCFEDDFLDDQANYVIRYYTRAWANGMMGAAWYTLNDPDWQESGLMDELDQSRPSYLALQFLATLLGDATYLGTLSSGSLEGYAFINGEIRYEFYWTNDTSTVAVTLPENTRFIYNKFGQRLVPSSNTIQVGFDPVVLEVQP